MSGWSQKLILAALTSFALATVAWAGERQVSLAWEQVADATRYEIELSQVVKGASRVLATHQSQEASLSLSLAEGDYYIRVRGIAQSETPGAWSEPIRFTVTPKLVPLLSPAKDQKLGAADLKDGMTFEWKGSPSDRGAEFVIEVFEAGTGRVVARALTPSPWWRWRQPLSGRYAWRVRRRDSQAWSAPQAFEILGLPGAPIAPARIVVTEGEVVLPRERWLALRLVEGLVTYETIDRDSGLSSSGIAISGRLGADVHWDEIVRLSRNWQLWGKLGGEWIRETVLEFDYSTFRGQAQIGAQHSWDEWALGPFVHLEVGTFNLFSVENATSIQQKSVLRQRLGVGVSARTEPTPRLLLRASAAVRGDLGGTADFIPNRLSPSLGYELLAGAAYRLSQRVRIEGTLRLQQESLAWKPAANTDSLSSVSRTQILIEVGLGFGF